MKNVLDTANIIVQGKETQAELVRTNLATANRGICGSRNNCYYTGKTVCYSIVIEGEFWFNFKRKTDAVAFLNWCVASQEDVNFTDSDSREFRNSEFYPNNFQGNC